MNQDIFLLSGTWGMEPRWYYVQVAKHRVPLLEKDLQGGAISNPGAYGKILCWGAGEEPPLYYRQQYDQLAELA